MSQDTAGYDIAVYLQIRNETQPRVCTHVASHEY